MKLSEESEKTAQPEVLIESAEVKVDSGNAFNKRVYFYYKNDKTSYFLLNRLEGYILFKESSTPNLIEVAKLNQNTGEFEIKKQDEFPEFLKNKKVYYNKDRGSFVVKVRIEEEFFSSVEGKVIKILALKSGSNTACFYLWNKETEKWTVTNEIDCMKIENTAYENDLWGIKFITQNYNVIKIGDKIINDINSDDREEKMIEIFRKIPAT